MANTLLLKRSGTANAVPLAGNIAIGELAINYTDGNLFYKNNSGVITVIASNQFLSVIGNITGGNILGGANVNAITHTGTTVSVSANITGGNVLTAGLISATGNITGNYIFGNGALLTGIDATSIQNGNSNVRVVSSGSNITIGVGGIANVVVFSTTGQFVSGVLSATGNITGGNLVTSGLINATGNITGDNVLTLGLISAFGNITGGNILGGANVNAITHTGTTVSVSANITGGNLITGGLISAAGSVNTNAVIGTSLTLTSTGVLNLSPSGNVVINAKFINGVVNPVQDQDVATKIYVDNLVSTAISYHSPVAAATTTTLATITGGAVTYTQPNGNGVGALLSTTGAFNLIDSANVQTVGTRILVKNQPSAVQNGIYTWANATNIIRSVDTNTYAAGSATALGINDYFFVSGGNVNLGSAYVVNAPTGIITFGTSNITFAEFSSSQTYTANTAAGISLAGTVINGRVDGTTLAFDGGGNFSVKAGAILTTPNIGAATGTSLSTTGNIIGGNVFAVTGMFVGGASVLNVNSTVDGGTY